MKALVHKFFKECVSIANAKAEFLESESGTVPQKTIIKKEKVYQSVTR